MAGDALINCVFIDSGDSLSPKKQPPMTFKSKCSHIVANEYAFYNVARNIVINHYLL